MLCYTYDYTLGSVLEVQIMPRSRPASNPISYHKWRRASEYEKCLKFGVPKVSKIWISEYQEIRMQGTRRSEYQGKT